MTFATGTDVAGCGPIANPCRALQYAHDSTSAGGEIDVLDSAGYGAVVIAKAIAIVGTGSIAGVLAESGGTAITINAAASDKVTLRGLTLEGAGVGAAGIMFNSGRIIDIADCAVKNFAPTAPALPGVPPGVSGFITTPIFGGLGIDINAGPAAVVHCRASLSRGRGVRASVSESSQRALLQ